MFLIAAAAAIFVGIMFAPVAWYFSRALCNSTTPREGYFASGIIFSGALSVTSALFMTARDYGRPAPFGMPEGQIFAYTLLLVWGIFFAYVLLSMIIKWQKWNVPVLFALTAFATVFGIDFLQANADVHFSGILSFIYYVLAIALIPAQSALAVNHIRLTKILSCQNQNLA